MASTDDPVVPTADPEAAVRDVLTRTLNDRGWGSRSALAKDLGVRPQTVTKWLQGESSPQPERWLEIERRLGLEPFTLAKASGHWSALRLDRLSPDSRRQAWERTFHGRRSWDQVTSALTRAMTNRVRDEVAVLNADDSPLSDHARREIVRRVGMLSTFLVEHLRPEVDRVFDEGVARVVAKAQEMADQAVTMEEIEALTPAEVREIVLGLDTDDEVVAELRPAAYSGDTTHAPRGVEGKDVLGGRPESFVPETDEPHPDD